MKKILVVVDMQNDFVKGSLGGEKAQAIIPNVVEKINQYKNGIIFITRDIHYDNYSDTLEGKKLPVPHCLYNTKGKEVVSEVWDAAQVVRKSSGKNKVQVIDKHTFGSEHLADILQTICKPDDVIELCGVCTDICVVSNALLLRAALPNNIIKVDASCCAGTDKKNHNAALLTMKNCQIDVYTGADVTKKVVKKNYTNKATSDTKCVEE